MKLSLLVPAYVLLILTPVVGVKLLIDSWNYDIRPYLNYERYPRSSTGEAVIGVAVNSGNLLATQFEDVGYIALLNSKGDIAPIKHQLIAGTPCWSKDGAIFAFKGGYPVSPSVSGCLPGLLTGENRYTFAYDFSTHREIGSAPPTWKQSAHIANLLRRHGGVAKKVSSSTVEIGLADQEKFKRADLNLHIYLCD